MTDYSLVLVWYWPSLGSAQQKIVSNAIEDKRERRKEVVDCRVEDKYRKKGKPKVNIGTKLIGKGLRELIESKKH